jgi:nitrogen fixation protein
VPVPADGVEVSVGGVSSNPYADTYDPPSMAMVRGASATANDTSLAVAAPYVPSVAIDAPIVQVPTDTNVTSPEEALMVQTPVVELEYVLVPVPADGVEVMVGGVASTEYEAAYDPLSIVSVRETNVTENDTVLAVAASYVPSAAMEEPIVQVPAATNVTTPVLESTVQTPVVELEYVLVPVPADGVEVMVGGVASSVYEPAYDPPSMVCVRDARVTENEIADAVATAYVPSYAMDAPMVHVPALTNATSPEEALTVQTPVVELE